MELSYTREFSSLAVRAAKAVDDGLNVTVFGHPGAGLRAVADALRSELAVERHVLPVNGVKSWQQLAFSGLSFARAAQPEAGHPSGPAGLRSVVDDVTRTVGANGVILVRRPEWLDAASVGVLSQVSELAHVGIVTVVDSVSLAARRVPLLDQLLPGLTIEVPLLSFDEVFRLAGECLGGAVEAETVARIRTESGGLYGIARAMIDVGRHSDALVLSDGVWRAAREFASDDIAAHIKYMLAGVTDAQITVLQAIAASSLDEQSFDPDPATADDLATLAEAGLVRREAGRWELFPPILDERMRHSRRIFLRGQLARTASGGLIAATEHARADSALQLRAWGISADAEAEAVAGQHIRTLNRSRAARHRAAWEESRAASDALPLVVALQTSGAARAEIAAVVTRTRRDPDSAEYAVLMVWWATYRELLLGEVDAGAAELREVEAGLPGFAPLFTAASTHLGMMVGGVIPDVAGIADDPAVDFGLGRVARIDALLFTGATREALALAENTTGVRPVFAAQLEISGNIARQLDGSIESGLDASIAALERAETAGNLGLMQAHSYAVMLGLVLNGRLIEARDFLDRSLAVSTSRALHSAFQLGTIALGILNETLSANRRAVLRLADIADTLPRSAVPLPGVDAFATDAVLALGDNDARTHRIIAERIARGHFVSAALLLMVSPETATDPALAHALREHTAASPSPLLRTIGDYAVAAADGDITTVLRLAEVFHGMGAGILCVAARSQAATLYFAAGQKAVAVALAQETWQISPSFGDARLGLLRPLAEKIGLTEREVETVRFGARGISNKEIAEALGLSQRTIESRWYSAYAKVGTSNRLALTLACTTWLRAASVSEKAAEPAEQ